MDKANIYIQKLIAFCLVVFAGIALSSAIKPLYLLPALFFTLGFLVSKITGEKPEYLWGLFKTDEFLNKKAGFWLLFKWILVLFGLVYDILAWTLFGIYILFTLILDFILLIKTIIFWILHAIIWFFKLFVPPLVFIYKMIIHYVFLWSWWIYKLSFNNAGRSINRNFYFISLRGSVLMLFIVLLFYGAGILMAMPEIVVVGAIFALLPLVWSYGEISALRLSGEESETWQHTKNNFRSGFDAVRAVLSYFIIFLILALSEVVFNVLGWIPQVGFTFMGLALNINTFASLILVFVFVILLFAKLILPAHVVYHSDFKSDLNGSLNFLEVIGKRFLRYLFSVVPTSFFGLVVAIIPAAIVFLSVVITLNVKNSLLDSRINSLQHRMNVLSGIEKYKTSKEISRLYFYKAYPGNVLNDFAGIKSLSKNLSSLNANILKGETEISSLSMEFSEGIDSLNKKMEDIKNLPMADSTSSADLVRIENLKHLRINNFAKWKEDGEYSISKMKADKTDKKGLIIQLPLVFLLTIIWVSFFAGLVLAFLISYLGNVYFELYNFREDGKPVYFRQVLSEMNEADRNQPLLGFTLLFLIIMSGLFFSQIISLFN